MGEATWRARLEELARLVRRTGNAAVDGADPALRPLHDWLEHQKALLALGALRLLSTCICIYASCMCEVHIYPLDLVAVTYLLLRRCTCIHTHICHVYPRQLTGCRRLHSVQLALACTVAYAGVPLLGQVQG